MGTAERVRAIVEPLLASRSLEVVDVEANGAQLRVTVDREGGVDLDALTDATRIVSRALDEHDPIPDRYTLEVSSPGLERILRTPDHFRRAVGSKVTVKTVPGTEGDRRVTGILTGSDPDGVTVAVEEPPPPAERRFRYDEIEKARTVFEWGPPPKPGRRAGRVEKKAGADSR